MPLQQIGLIGGMSWESTAQYYRIINQGIRNRLGGMHSAYCLLWSFDFAEIEVLQRAGRWDEASRLLIGAAGKLEQCGADFFLMCTNTMHCVAEAVEAAVKIPLLHIADATAVQINKAGFKKIGLLGTTFTMEQDFYRGRLEQRFGMEVLVPGKEERDLVHRIIYEELVHGQIKSESHQVYKKVIKNLVARGVQAVVLGCTEIMLLVHSEDSSVPLFDTTTIHAEAAVERALGITGSKAGSL